jgi:hypothetical protein
LYIETATAMKNLCILVVARRQFTVAGMHRMEQ